MMCPWCAATTPLALDMVAAAGRFCVRGSHDALREATRMRAFHRAPPLRTRTSAAVHCSGPRSKQRLWGSPMGRESGSGDEAGEGSRPLRAPAASPPKTNLRPRCRQPSPTGAPRRCTSPWARRIVRQAVRILSTGCSNHTCNLREPPMEDLPQLESRRELPGWRRRYGIRSQR